MLHLSNGLCPIAFFTWLLIDVGSSWEILLLPVHEFVFQLLYTGMLETTKIRREGFAVRPAFEEFVNKWV